MKSDLPAQQLLINSLRNQIESWREYSSTLDPDNEERSDVENDIGYAFTILSSLESSFRKEFDIEPE